MMNKRNGEKRKFSSRYVFPIGERVKIGLQVLYTRILLLINGEIVMHGYATYSHRPSIPNMHVLFKDTSDTDYKIENLHIEKITSRYFEQTPILISNDDFENDSQNGWSCGM